MNSIQSERQCGARVQIRSTERQLVIDDKAAKIGARAFDVLQALFERRDRVVTKDELLDLVWPGLVVEENNLQVQICTLRRFLGSHAIATVPGLGYRFTLALGSAGPPADAASPPIAPAPAFDADAPGNLPARLPELYGRAADVDAVRLLTLRNQLVTVVGAVGIGKTTLAHAVAHALRDSFEDGAWLVELAPLAAASEVTSTVAATLHIALGEDRSADALARRLRSSRMLLVLDNCEHLVDSVAALASSILRLAPGVRLLVSSQESLRVGQEQIYRLGALSLPDSPELASALAAGALALFEARARAADPRFALNDRNIGAVVEICRNLDGVALAIELAAARVRLLGVEGLRSRLDERFKVLTCGARIALRRHQTLRAALDWSHHLLTADEQKVFRRLGVFVGTFALDSVQMVAGDGIDADTVIGLLSSLVDRSLVAIDAGEPPRYRLLQTTRAYALEALGEAGETAQVMRQHAVAMAERFERHLDDLYRLTKQEALVRYLPDLDNARAALDWCGRPDGDRRLQIRLTGAIGLLWNDAGLRPEGQRRVLAAIEQIDESTPPHLEARLLVRWAWLAHPAVGPRELAANARAVQLWRSLGDRKELFAALCNQIRFQTYCGEIAQATDNLEEAESLFDPSWPPGARLALLMTRSWVLQVQGRYDESLRWNVEILERANARGDEYMAVAALINIEQNAAVSGRLEESVMRNRELQQRLRKSQATVASCEHFVAANLAISLTRLGLLDEALAAARAALVSLEKADRVFDLLEQSVLLAARRGRVEDAARIFGCSERTFAREHLRRDKVEQQQHAECVAALHAALAPDELARLMREGESMSVDEAVRLAQRA